MAQILVNSRLCAEGHRPICQDTGMVVVFLKIGMEVRWETHPEHPGDGRRGGAPRLSASGQSCCAPPWSRRPSARARNTGDNTPAVVHVELVPGDKVEVRLAAKGGGSENKSKFAILNPSDSLVDWVLQDGPAHGRGLVSAGHAGHRHRRLVREGHAAGQGGPAGARSTSTNSRRAARPTPSRNCAWNSSRRSTRSASAPRDWAA